MINACRFPSADALQRCTGGELGACALVARISIERALLMAVGMAALSGTRKRLVARSVVGSAAIQAALAATKGDGLPPSAVAAVKGDPVEIVATMLGRAAVVAVALGAVGLDRPVQSGLASALTIEVAVLTWAAQCRKMTNASSESSSEVSS